jgi:hypothetical protein
MQRRAARRSASRFTAHAAALIFFPILAAFPMAADAQCVSAAQILAGSPFPLCSVPASVPPSGLPARLPSGLTSRLAPGVQLLPQLLGVLGALQSGSRTTESPQPAAPRAIQPETPVPTQDALTRQLEQLLKPCTLSAWQGLDACNQAQQQALALLDLNSRTLQTSAAQRAQPPIVNPPDVPSYIDYGSHIVRWQDGLELRDPPGVPPSASGGSVAEAEGRLCRAGYGSACPGGIARPKCPVVNGQPLCP